MNNFWTLAALVLALALPNAVNAQVDTTTRFGVTVTPEDIWTAADESRLFWAYVRQALDSEDIAVNNEQLRGQALAALKATDRLMTEQALNDDSLPDVIEFLATRVRRYQLYRQLREAIADDKAFCRLVDEWETGRWQISLLPESERPAASKKHLEDFRPQVLAAGVAPAKQAEVLQLWSNMNECQDHMLTLETCRRLIELQSKVAATDPALRNMLRRIALAADWALITRVPRSPCPRCEEFVHAWRFCHKHVPDVAERTGTRPETR